MGDSIKAAKDADGNIWVGVRWVCDALDMTEGQMKRQVKNISSFLMTIFQFFSIIIRQPKFKPCFFGIISRSSCSWRHFNLLSNDTTLTIQHTPKGVCLIIVSPFGAVVKH